MNKYIVKNCPAYEFCHCKSMKYAHDCALKRMILLCKLNIMSEEELQNNSKLSDFLQGAYYGRDTVANGVLQLFDIEEVE